MLTDDTGAITDAYGISAYGDVVTARSGNATDNPFTWQGQFGVMQEPGSGMFYARFRYYDSGTARFLSRDPITSPAPRRINPYQYAAGNPVGNGDPEGLKTTSAAFPPDSVLYEAIRAVSPEVLLNVAPMLVFAQTPGNGYSNIIVDPINPSRAFIGFEKTFAGSTFEARINVPNVPPNSPPISVSGLWDYRPGDDSYDIISPFQMSNGPIRGILIPLPITGAPGNLIGNPSAPLGLPLAIPGIPITGPVPFDTEANATFNFRY